MGCTKTINYRLSLFFNLSFIANKGGTKNKKSIFFNICQIFAFFEDFSRFHNVICSFHFKNWQKFGKKLRKALYRIFFSAINKNIQQNLLRKIQFVRFFTEEYLSFIAKNGLKFIVFGNKSKSNKNATHIHNYT